MQKGVLCPFSYLVLWFPGVWTSAAAIWLCDGGSYLVSYRSGPSQRRMSSGKAEHMTFGAAVSPSKALCCWLVYCAMGRALRNIPGYRNLLVCNGCFHSAGNQLCCQLSLFDLERNVSLPPPCPLPWLSLSLFYSCGCSRRSVCPLSSAA